MSDAAPLPIPSAGLPPVARLLEIVACLRAPGGCPWDREQTHASLRPHLVEEAYETVEAIEREMESRPAAAADGPHGDPGAHLCEELGDILLQVALHAQIAAEAGRFTFDDVAGRLAEKLIRRHPHVFGETAAGSANQAAPIANAPAHTAANPAEALQRWDAVKRRERAEKGQPHASLLDGVTEAIPSLMHAEKITRRAAQVGFDWETPVQVIGKIREELAETEEALADAEKAAEAASPVAGPERTRALETHRAKIEEEFGDLLFAAVNLARKIRVEPEVALRRATHKFSRRFRALELALQAQNRRPADCTLAEMDAVWDDIKRQERAEPREA